MSESWRELEGTTLGGRYRLERLLGHGGMGAVYEARQLDLERVVAIKVLRTDDALGLDRFRREALAAGGLASPHVVAVYDFKAVPDELAYLVMERLEGQSLADLLAREKKLALGRAARIASEMLVGLDAAHRAGIVHRDVKPSNVWLLSAYGVQEHVKLLDFGVAKLLDPGATKLTSSQQLLGTPSYLAPEQLRGADVDARTDIHAVGAVLYEAITGRRPFIGSRDGSLFVEILNKVPTPLHQVDPTVPLQLSLVVARALAKDPEARYARADQMRHALAPFATSEEPVPPTVDESRAGDGTTGSFGTYGPGVASHARSLAPPPPPPPPVREPLPADVARDADPSLSLRTRDQTVTSRVPRRVLRVAIGLGLALVLATFGAAAFALLSVGRASAPPRSDAPLEPSPSRSSEAPPSALPVTAPPVVPPTPTPVDEGNPPRPHVSPKHKPSSHASSASPLSQTAPTSLSPSTSGGRCTCIDTRSRRMLCQKPHPPSCQCKVESLTLCPERMVRGQCKFPASNGPGPYVGDWMVTGHPCRGFDANGEHHLDGSAVCTTCWGSDTLAGVEGEACTGIQEWGRGESSGTLVCH